MRVLVHHGIKGQRWGVRNGPPYPLDAKRKRLNKLKSGSFFGDYVKKIQEAGEQELINKYPKLKDRSPDNNMKQVNPHFGDTNCAACSLALLARVNKGIDIKAKDCPMVQDDAVTHGLFNGIKLDTFTGRPGVEPSGIFDDIEKQVLEKYKEGDNGVVQIFERSFRFAHIMTWFIENGKIVYRDPQLASLKEKYDDVKDVPCVLRTDEDKYAYWIRGFGTDMMRFGQANNLSLFNNPLHHRQMFE